MKKVFKTEIFFEFMKQNNLSKTQFCKLCKISISTFNKILSHQMNFRITALLKIAKTIKIQIHQMVY